MTRLIYVGMREKRPDTIKINATDSRTKKNKIVKILKNKPSWAKAVKQICIKCTKNYIHKSSKEFKSKVCRSCLDGTNL